MNHTYVHTRGNEQSRCFGLRIPSSAKSTPDFEKRNDFHRQLVVVVVEEVVSGGGGGGGDGDGDGGGSSSSNSIVLLEVIPVKVNYKYLHYIELHV